MITDELTVIPPSVSDDHAWTARSLEDECIRLLESMEAKVQTFEKHPGHPPFTWRGLDEINFLGTTFRGRMNQLTELEASSKHSDLQQRADQLVENFLNTKTTVYIAGSPDIEPRSRLRELLGLSIPPDS